MDKTKVGIAVVVWGLIVTVDVVQGFFGIWSIIGYVILGVLIWILLSAGEPERQESQPITPLRQEVQQPKQPKPIPFND